MARDPKYDGLGCEGYVTFKSALTRGTDEGKPVKVSADKTVALCANNDNFMGIVKTIEQASDKAAGVQITGLVEVGYSGSAPVVNDANGGWNFLVADGAGKVKVAALPNVVDSIVTKSVTVNAGQTSGSSADDAALVGASVVGIVPAGNQDQFVDNVTVNGSGAVTVTLGAAATANNVFTVTLEKATVGDLTETSWPNRYLVVDVDETNSKCTIMLPGGLG